MNFNYYRQELITLDFTSYLKHTELYDFADESNLRSEESLHGNIQRGKVFRQRKDY